MTKITITEAMVELKTLSKRIESARTHLLPPLVQAGAVNFPTGHDETTYKAEAASKLQSLQDLMNRRLVIKNAIAASNATTNVTIGTESMTVQEAIIRKNNSDDEKMLVSTLVRMATKKIQDNTSLGMLANDAADKILSQRAGSAADNVTTALADATRTARQPITVDPYGDIVEYVTKLEEKFLMFASNVDVQLTISNSTTFIEV